MRKVLIMLCLASLIMIVGCAAVASPVSGTWFIDVKGPIAATPGEGTKTGEAYCESYLGLVGMGDASIEAACRNGGITKIKSVDFKAFQVLGLYAKFTTIVTGE